MATLDSDDLAAIATLLLSGGVRLADGVAHGGTVNANVVSINGTTFNGPGVPSDRVMFSGVLGNQSGGGPYQVILPTVPAGFNVLLGSRLRIISGSGRDQERTIVYSNGVDTVGLDHPWSVAAVSGDAFQVLYDNSHQMSTDGSEVAAYLSDLPPDGLARFFNMNSGQTYADAVDGSVVKEIATHAVGVGGGGPVDVNVVSIRGNVNAAVNLAAQLLAQFNGVVSSDSPATTTTFAANTTGSPGLSTVNGKYINSVVAFYGGTETPLARKISGYTYSGGVGTFTITPPLDTAPTTDGTAGFIILGFTP